MHNYTLNEKRCDHFAAPFLCIMRISAKSIEKRDGVWYNVLYVFVTTSAAEISSYAMTKLNRDLPVSMEVMMNLCKVFHCDIGDLMEVIEED